MDLKVKVTSKQGVMKISFMTHLCSLFLYTCMSVYSIILIYVKTNDL